MVLTVMPSHMIAYTSRCMIPPAYQKTEVKALVHVSRIRNAAENVTGALVFTEEHFAQTIEGPVAAVRAIMESIRRDSRHSSIVMLHDGPIPRRRYSRWSLAYHGYVASLDTKIRAAAFEADRPAGRGRAIVDLLDEMQRLAPEL